MRSNWRAIGRCLLAGIVAASACALAIRARQGVETDLYALADAKHGGELRELAASMAGQGRILLEGRDVDQLQASVREIRQFFGQSAGSLDVTLKLLADRHAGLLAPGTRTLLQNGRYREVAEAAYARLYGFVPPLVSAKEDPFLLATDYLTSLQDRQPAGWRLRDGELTRETNGLAQILVTLDLSKTSQRDVAAFLASIEHKAASRKPSIWCGGPPFHSALATANAQTEINVLSSISILMVISLGWMLFRSFRFVAPLLATLGVAFLVAAATLFAASPRPHVLTFVFGTSLIGLAVDYVYHTRMANGDRSVLKPLALSLLTTEACLAPLLLSVVPVLRQMALFTGAGLAAAFAWTVVWGNWRAASRATAAPAGKPTRLPKYRILLVLLAACGLFRLRFSSDPSGFYTPDRYLAESERRLASCLPAEARRFVIVRGRTIQEALEREEDAGLQGVTAFIPSLRRQRENARLKAKLYEAEGREYAAKTGLRKPEPNLDGPWFVPENIGDGWIARAVRGMIFSGGVIAPCPDGFTPTDPNLRILDPKRTLGELFDRFTSATLHLLGASCLVLAMLLIVIFRKKAPAYIMSLCATFAATAGMLGWLGVPVTFFTLLCFFAVAGLGLDYSIFCRHQTSAAARRTVLFSFLTSFAGLGMLAFTGFAVTRAMGTAFACGLFFAWLCAGDGRQDGCDELQCPWHRQREQSAGRGRMLFMWYVYVLFGKTVQKLVCMPVVLFIYPFARPAREALREFYQVLSDFKGVRRRKPPIFRHMLGFAWSLADKTDACTLRKNLPAMSIRNDAGWRSFLARVASGKGVFIMSTHLGTIEVLPALGKEGTPRVHAFQQMGHDAVFTRIFANHLDATRLKLHPVEDIGVETAVLMQEAIARGELVLMAGDRISAGSPRVLKHEFLGRPCVWPKGAFVFAKLMEAPVFFVTCVRTGWNAYDVHMREHAPQHGKSGLEELLDAYVCFLEEETLAHPEQWYQFYRFFSNAAMPDAQCGNRRRR